MSLFDFHIRSRDEQLDDLESYLLAQKLVLALARSDAGIVDEENADYAGRIIYTALRSHKKDEAERKPRAKKHRGERAMVEEEQ